MASMDARLQLRRYSRKACLAALRGEAVPNALGDPVHRLCVIRGIRYHPSFGSELYGVLPIFTRALNARSIMSNVIPDLSSPDTIPYCIWHPQVALEHTYRQLITRHPHMVYQVGRACAVAGYVNLYKELHILPDIHIAEEARECGHQELFDYIMSQPARYSIMDDYERRVNPEERQPAHLNGDTAVRWMLEVKQGFKDATITGDMEDEDDQFTALLFGQIGFEEKVFNITEDMNIDEHDSSLVAARLLSNRVEVSLLSSPLPADLPTVQKDLLIVMAAYTGDVDRYARLRRPRYINNEIECCIRGIYHSTFFALWWSQQPGEIPPRCEAAINARFIMNNVLSRVTKASQTPYLIWWPTKARPSTYRQLAKLRPDMLPQIVHATIYCSYKDLFDELVPQITPDRVLLRAAESKRDTHYLNALQARAQSLGTLRPDAKQGQGWKDHLMGGYFGMSYNGVMKYLDASCVGVGFDIPYDGKQCEAGEIETTVMLPDAWKLTENDSREYCELDYVEWPLSARPESAD